MDTPKKVPLNLSVTARKYAGPVNRAWRPQVLAPLPVSTFSLSISRPHRMTCPTGSLDLALQSLKAPWWSCGSFLELPRAGANRVQHIARLRKFYEVDRLTKGGEQIPQSLCWRWFSRDKAASTSQPKSVNQVDHAVNQRTALERNESIREWVELTGLQLVQDAPNESKREDGRGHRQRGGVREAERQLGLEHRDVHRALKTASLSPEAKQAARDAGWAGLAFVSCPATPLGRPPERQGRGKWPQVAGPP